MIWKMEKILEEFITGKENIMALPQFRNKTRIWLDFEELASYLDLSGIVSKQVIMNEYNTRIDFDF